MTYNVLWWDVKPYSVNHYSPHIKILVNEKISKTRQKPSQFMVGRICRSSVKEL